MKAAKLTAFLLLGGVPSLVANEETTYLVPQPLVAFGDTEDWTTTGKPDITDEMYMILGMPYFQKHDHGPVYRPIAFPRLMPNSDSGGGPLRDCNLLSRCGIAITRKPFSETVYLDLSKAEAERNSALTLEVAGYAALECIRIVMDRYQHEITVRVIPPKDGADRWKEVERAFNKHDKTKPFTRQKAREDKRNDRRP